MAPIHVHREDPSDHSRMWGDFPDAPEPLVSVTDASGRIDRWLGEPPDAEGRVPRFERTRELPCEALVALHGVRWSAAHARAWSPASARIVIGEEDVLVPRWALDAPEPPRRRGWERAFTLSPRLAHRYLQLYVRADDALVRELGHALVRLKGVDGWRALGVARLEDYARERLGCTRRWAQQLMRLHETLERSAPLREAHTSGALSTAKVLALAPLARAVAEGVGDLVIPEERLHEWIARGRGASVRKLKEAYRTEWAAAELRAELEAEEGAVAAGAVNADVHDGTRGEESAPDTPDGEWVQFRAPAPVAYLHELAVDIARAMAPEAQRPGACVELMLAERLASHGLPLDDGNDVDAGGAGGAGARDVDAGGWRYARDAIHEPRRVDGHLGAEEATESVALIASLLAAHVPPTPEALDRHLRRLVRARQRRRTEMRRLLHHVQRHRLWKPLGYRSFRTYCERALGLAERTAQELVATEEALTVLPAVAEAFARGAISAAHVACLIDVATPETEAVWLARARAVTVRYLEREVAEAVHRATATGEAPLPCALSTRPPYGEHSPVRPGAALAAALGDGAVDEGTGGDGTDGDGTEARTCSHGVPRAFRVMPSATRWVIRFWLPRDVHGLWKAVDRAIGEAFAAPTRPWQRYVVLLAGALEEWCLQSEEARTRTETYRIHEREGFMCAVPGCTHRASFEGHHVVFRSAGGDDGPGNRVSLCPVHHRLGVHGAWALAVSGEAPDDLTWEMGIGTFRGDVRVA